jgi:signal transduction histidine kinase
MLDPDEATADLFGLFLRSGGGSAIIIGLTLGVVGVAQADPLLLGFAAVAVGVGGVGFAVARMARPPVVPLALVAFGCAGGVAAISELPLAFAACMGVAALGFTMVLLSRRAIPLASVGVLTVAGIFVFRHDDPWAVRMAGFGVTVVGLAAMSYVLLSVRDHYSRLADSRLSLLASVSHELRTPLTGVVGFAELLLSGGGELEEPERRDALLTICREAGDVAAVLDDLLVASRLELDNMPVAGLPVDLAAQVRQVVEGFSPVSARAIEVTADTAPRVTADPARVRQVIRNLVANALKHGGPTVALSVEESGIEGVVHVTDDGSGPSPEVEARMFSAFVSGHVPDGRPGSFGLGLSISRRLARAMGGDVRYDRVGGHTRFSLHLPLTTD